MRFIADPPLPLGRRSHGGLKRQAERILKGFWRIFWQSFWPFNPEPEPFRDPPRPNSELSDVQLKQCETYFNQVETTRDALEAKARATFSLVAFLAPLMASIFVFFITRSFPDTVTRNIAIAFASLSFLLLLLGFLSITRAVAVRTRQTLGYNSIVDFERCEFRRYNKAFHARGLLWCASYNDALNGHIAQFVKSANILTALAVLALIVAAIPAAFLFTDQPTIIKAQMVGPVGINSTAFAEVQKDIATLARGVAALASDKTRVQRVDAALSALQADLADLVKRVAEFPNNSPRDQRLIALEGKLDQLVASLRELQAEIQRQRSNGDGAAKPSLKQ